ncbi:MAG: phosphate-starvation-inducible PsiE family protein [Pyrinomonadaceae bacterium]
MLKIVDSIEKFIIRALIIMMLAAILLGTIELGRVLILEIFAPPFFLLDITRLFEGFGLLLVILIGVELLKVLKMFLTEDKIKPEIVVEVAVIALCNKIITLDIKHTTGDVLLGLATLLIGLSFGYFVLRFRAVDKELSAKEQKS